MGHDLVFAISGADAQLSEPVSLREAGPPTSDSYTEWITQHPQLLGANVRVVAADVRWNDGSAVEDVVLDVLGLDDDGRLVVGVVLVGDEPQQVLVRALTQAAYASRLDPEALAEMHASHLRARGEHHSEDAALRRLASHAGGHLGEDMLARPRMVLFCEHVSAALGTTITWLDEMDLDIVLQRLRAYELDRQTLLIVSRLFPSEPVTDFEVVPARRLQAVSAPFGGGNDAVDHAGGLYDGIDYDSVDYDDMGADEGDDDAMDQDATDHDGDHHDAMGDHDLSIPGERGYRAAATDADVVFTNGFGHGPQPETP